MCEQGKDNDQDERENTIFNNYVQENQDPRNILKFFPKDEITK